MFRVNKRPWEKFFNKSMKFVDDDGAGAGGEGADFSGTDEQGGDTTGVIDDTAVAGQDKQPDANAAIRAEKAKLKAKHDAEISQYKALTDRMMRATGMNEKQLAEKLEAFEQQQQMKQSGLDPTTYQHLSGMAGTVRQVYEQNLALQQKIEESELKADPIYSDYDEVAESVKAHAAKTGMTLRQAYWSVNGENRSKQLAREAEQRTIAQRESNAGAGVVSSKGSPQGQANKFESQDEAFVANAFGIEADEHNALKNSKNIDDWLNFLKKKK